MNWSTPIFGITKWAMAAPIGAVGPATVVVGVVSEVKYAGLDKPDEGTVYAPLNPQGHSRYLLLRTAADPASVLPALREAVCDLDARLPLSNLATIRLALGGSRRDLFRLVVGQGMGVVAGGVAIGLVQHDPIRSRRRDVGPRRETRPADHELGLDP